MMWYRIKPRFRQDEESRMFLARTDKKAIEYVKSTTDNPHDYLIEELVDNEPIRRVPMGLNPMNEVEQLRAVERFKENKGE